MVISKYEAPESIRFVPANWPELVTLLIDINMASHIGSPPDTAINPNVKETGMYPRPIGMPFLNPLTKSFINSQVLSGSM